MLKFFHRELGVYIKLPINFEPVCWFPVLRQYARSTDGVLAPSTAPALSQKSASTAPALSQNSASTGNQYTGSKLVGSKEKFWKQSFEKKILKKNLLKKILRRHCHSVLAQYLFPVLRQYCKSVLNGVIMPRFRQYCAGTVNSIVPVLKVRGPKLNSSSSCLLDYWNDPVKNLCAACK